MLAIVDARAPQQAIENLKKISDDLLLFKSEGITYDSISCHPDIFIYKDETNTIIAPNAPSELFDFLKMHNVHYETGISKIGRSLESSTFYNCLSTEKLFFHKAGFTDKNIEQIVSSKEFIKLPQAYTRCSLNNLGNDSFITSDRGIEKVLKENGLNYFYFDPAEIIIPNHKNGFLGGTCGVYKNKIYFLGNIQTHSDGAGLKYFIEGHGFEIVSLCDDKLYDGGGIFFL